jgi:hypothetical protein
MIGAFEEFDELVGKRILIDWYTRITKKNDDLVLGRAGAMSPKMRATWRGGGERPWWRVELSLPYWLAVDDQKARERLVHHELMHLKLQVLELENGDEVEKPKIRNHHVEEFVHTIRRFGPMPGSAQEEFIAEGMRWLSATKPEPRPQDDGEPQLFDRRSSAAGDR